MFMTLTSWVDDEDHPLVSWNMAWNIHQLCKPIRCSKNVRRCIVRDSIPGGFNHLEKYQWGWDDIPYMQWIEMENNPLMFETTHQIWYWSHLITCRFPTEDLKVVWHPLIITARGRWLDCTETLAGASEESESTQSCSPGYGSSLNKGWVTYIYTSHILLLSLLLLFLVINMFLATLHQGQPPCFLGESGHSYPQNLQPLLLSETVLN